MRELLRPLLACMETGDLRALDDLSAAVSGLCASDSRRTVKAIEVV